MKRTLRILLVAALLIGLSLSAYAGGAQDQKAAVISPGMDFGGRTITIGNWGDRTAAPRDDSEDGRREIAYRESLERMYNFKFAYEAVPGNDDASLQKFITTTMAGAPFAEINTFMMDRIPPIAAQGLLYPLNTITTLNMNSDRFNSAVRNATTMADGNIYAINTSGDRLIGNKMYMIFNKSLAQREGLPDLYDLWRRGEWTWDKLYEISAKVTRDTNGDGTIDQWAMSADNNRLSLMFVTATGIPTIDTQNRVQYSHPKMIEALDYFTRFRSFVAPPPQGSNWDWYIVEFGSGKILFNATGSAWHYGRFKDMEDDFGNIPFPTPRAGDPYYVYSDAEGCLGVPYNVENPDHIGVILTALAAPREWAVKGSYLRGLEANVRDEESVEVVRFLCEDATFIIDKQRSYGVFWSDPGWSALTGKLFKGEMTANQAAQAYTGPTQEKINAVLSGN